MKAVIETENYKYQAIWEAEVMKVTSREAPLYISVKINRETSAV